MATVAMGFLLARSKSLHCTFCLQCTMRTGKDYCGLLLSGLENQPPSWQEVQVSLKIKPLRPKAGKLRLSEGKQFAQITELVHQEQRPSFTPLPQVQQPHHRVLDHFSFLRKTMRFKGHLKPSGSTVPSWCSTNP